MRGRNRDDEKTMAYLDWSPLVADCAARIYGIYPLGDRHWQAIGATREEFLRNGASPDLPAVCNICGLPCSELAELFPNTGTTLYALAGVPAPRAPESTDPTPEIAGAESKQLPPSTRNEE